MYTLFRLLPVKQLAYEEAPALVCSWLIAEWFYKFHSFTLECAAFLMTWLVLDFVIQWIVHRCTIASAPLYPLTDEARGSSSEDTSLTDR